MTSSNGNILRVTGPLWGESGDRWIPLTKASDAELWCFVWSAPEQNSWANNGDAGELRRHCAYYDVTVMITVSLAINYLVCTTCCPYNAIQYGQNENSIIRVERMC